MTAYKILMADNNAAFLKIRADFLIDEGFNVITASDPTEARRLLEAGGIDLAILDLRLINDNDDNDVSGLSLAKDIVSQVPAIVSSGFFEKWIPTIVLTAHPTYEQVREALAPVVGGIPAAVAFIAKQEGAEKMLQSVRTALNLKEEGIPIILDGDKVADRPVTRLISGSALLMLFSAVIAGILAMVLNDPRWLAGTVTTGILFGVLTWGIAR